MWITFFSSPILSLHVQVHLHTSKYVTDISLQRCNNRVFLDNSLLLYMQQILTIPFQLKYRFKVGHYKSGMEIERISGESVENTQDFRIPSFSFQISFTIRNKCSPSKKLNYLHSFLIFCMLIMQFEIEFDYFMRAIKKIHQFI